MKAIGRRGAPGLFRPAALGRSRRAALGRSRSAALVGLVLLGLAALGCGAGSWAPPEVPGAGAPAMPEQRLLPVEALGEDVLMRQRVTIQWNGREADFDAVLQKRGAQLLLLGLGPMDRVGFRLVLEDGRVEFENRTGRELPFDPDRILLDVQRVFYPWLERDAGCGSCDRHGSRDGIEITERIEAGRLEERRFRVPDRVDVADVVVRYEDWMEDGLAPRRAVLANGWRGYALRVETSSAERLE